MKLSDMNCIKSAPSTTTPTYPHAFVASKPQQITYITHTYLQSASFIIAKTASHIIIWATEKGASTHTTPIFVDIGRNMNMDKATITLCIIRPLCGMSM
jgi:hypothetical protein